MTKKCFLIVLVCLAISGFSQDAGQIAQDVSTIHTRGDPELLWRVFEALKQILYGDAQSGLEQTFNALLRISLTVGGFCCLALAFSRQKFEPLIRSFLIPGLIIVGFLLVPRTKVEIKEKKETVEVPFFLGKFAVWTSFAFDKLHGRFQKAIGNTYPWTGNMYSGKNFLSHGSVPLSDSRLEENLREFCRECVVRDLGLGLYMKKELAQAPNLLQFLAQHTSANRAVVYVFPDEKSGAIDPKPISCQEAAKLLHESILVQSPDLSVSRLFSGPETLAEQKMAIDLLQEEIFMSDLKWHRKESFGATGAFALMSLHGFFEAVLYLIFPLIVLFSLLSFGIRTALLWIQSIVWVSTWPIFYLAVDLFLDTVWKFRGGNTALNLENAALLTDLYHSMEIIACAVLACIPFLSWFLIKGSISQLVHIASSLPISEKTEQTAKTQQQQNPLPKDDPQDASRQTHWEILSREAERPPSEDGFKATVEDSKLEERVNSLQNSLSSIRQSVKDSSTNISKALKDTGRAAQTEFDANTPSSPLNHKADENWGGSRMHIPSHGSWGAADPK